MPLFKTQSHTQAHNYTRERREKEPHEYSYVFRPRDISFNKRFRGERCLSETCAYVREAKRKHKFFIYSFSPFHQCTLDLVSYIIHIYIYKLLLWFWFLVVFSKKNRYNIRVIKRRCLLRSLAMKTTTLLVRF